jgi:polyribonucleotide nucleotidyltransferase
MSEDTMFNEVTKEIEWAGRQLILKTGKVARQAGGAVIASYGETVVLCTAVARSEPKEGIDFFPLTVTYQEKAFAAGKIPGGFFKREGRPSEKETLISRLIDRPIRPLFPEGFRNETQVICTVLSHDVDVDTDIISLIGASAALAISGVPFDGPVGAAKVAYINNEYVLNPTPDDMVTSDLDLIVAGTTSSVLMVESEAKMLSEEIMLGAVEFGHKEMQPIIKLINELKDVVGKPVWEVVKADNSKLETRIAELAEAELRAAYKETVKQNRVAKISAAKDAAIVTLKAELAEEFNSQKVGNAFKYLEKNIVRKDIITNRTRIDGRGEKDVRQIQSEVQILPKTHGSSLFTRGETQALVVATLGTAQDMQMIDDLSGDYKQHFMLHYNFPPYSVGEASMMRSPGRREIGHGKLAWRAVRASLPTLEEFPYTIRVVSEITESNGSSSMATVCGATLAMMDAGVPLKAPVAGIAMGLIKEGEEFSVLSDILGDEDHLGDMDFKVAGTASGVTALQMDIKINGITTQIMKVALDQAKEGRLHILKRMTDAMPEARSGVSQNAPQITTIKINKEKIGELIGPGGKMIRQICEESGAKIDIEEDGTVKVAAIGKEATEKAIQMINDITADIEIGKIFAGKVVRLLEFGALVNFIGKTDGLVHISEIKKERVEDINSVITVGDEVKVKVLSVERGKVRLSMKRVNQETGEDLSGEFEDDGTRPRGGERRPPRGPRSDNRGGDRRPSGGNRGRDDRNSNSGDSEAKPTPAPEPVKEEAPVKKKRFFF